jgi:hypothetical protein
MLGNWIQWKEYPSSIASEVFMKCFMWLIAISMQRMLRAMTVGWMLYNGGVEMF